MIATETVGADPTLLGLAALVTAILTPFVTIAVLLLTQRGTRARLHRVDARTEEIARSVNHIDEEPCPDDGPQTLGQLVRAGFDNVERRLAAGDERFDRLEASQRRVEHEVRNVRQVQMNMIETGAGDLWRLIGGGKPPPVK